MATVKGQQEVVVNLDKVHDHLMAQIVAGINEVGLHALDRALKDVPVRRVFATTPEGKESRQSVRTMSPLEVINERRERNAAGLGFGPIGGVSGIRTTWFPEFNYRSRNRANVGDETIRRRGIGIRPVTTKTGIGKSQTRGERYLPDEDAERDLNAQGRYELKRKGKGGKGFAHRNQLGGALRGTVEGRQAKAGRRVKYVVRAGGKDAPYAKFVEFGTRHSKAQPFLRPALAQARTELVRTMSSFLRGGR